MEVSRMRSYQTHDMYLSLPSQGCDQDICIYVIASQGSNQGVCVHVPSCKSKEKPEIICDFFTANQFGLIAETQSSSIA